MARPKEKGSVTLWAWIVSIALHLTLLLVFAIVKFSRFTAANHIAAPSARITTIKKLLQSSPTLPKPKIKNLTKSYFTREKSTLTPIKQIFNNTKPVLTRQANLQKPFTSSTLLPPYHTTAFQPTTEFFGNPTNQRKICYVVDCSGSMKGILGRVKQKLKQSVANLQPDQYFCIIFFGGDKLLTFNNERMVRATPKAKTAACAFIESVRAAGRTNALVALEKALQISDDNGVPPEVIYFLTDGFELTNEDSGLFLQKTAAMTKRSAPKTTINTIGFWPQSQDRKMLQTIAAQSGGRCVFITSESD